MRSPAETDALGQQVAAEHRLAWLLVVGGFVGLAAAFTLLVEKIALIKDPSYVPTCSINPILSCGSIMRTEQAEAFGFPNPIIGVAGFAVSSAPSAPLSVRTHHMNDARTPRGRRAPSARPGGSAARNPPRRGGGDRRRPRAPRTRAPSVLGSAFDGQESSFGEVLGQQPSELLTGLASGEVSGGAVYDALVGAAAREQGVALATLDQRALDTYPVLGVETVLLGGGTRR